MPIYLFILSLDVLHHKSICDQLGTSVVYLQEQVNIYIKYRQCQENEVKALSEDSLSHR